MTAFLSPPYGPERGRGKGRGPHPPDGEDQTICAPSSASTPMCVPVCSR